MKFGITLSALAAVLMLGSAFVTPAEAQTKADCRQHLAGTKRTTNQQAIDAANKRYRECMAKAKK
jgi:uncharacterized membrane protein